MEVNVELLIGKKVHDADGNKVGNPKLFDATDFRAVSVVNLLPDEKLDIYIHTILPPRSHRRVSAR